MFSSRLGRLFGIDVYIHSTFWLLPLFVIFGGLTEGSMDAAEFEVAVLFGVFGSVLLHEVGHALAARFFGISTRDITLYPIGGIARLARFPRQPAQEIVIALAGPAVNVVIAAILFLILMTGQSALHSSSVQSGYSYETDLVTSFLSRLLTANLFLFGFNLLPAFPMDGGRVLRALLSFGLDRVAATRVAVTIGGFVALGFCLLGLLVLGNPMLAFLGVAVFLLGRAELEAVTREDTRRRSDRFQWRDIGPQPGVDRFTGLRYDPHTGVWTQWRDGRIVG